jgi:hypothetical protein
MSSPGGHCPTFFKNPGDIINETWQSVLSGSAPIPKTCRYCQVNGGEEEEEEGECVKNCLSPED